MAERAYATTTVGLELTSRGLKGVGLSYRLRKPQVDKLFYIQFDASKKQGNFSFIKDQMKAHLDFSNIYLSTDFKIKRLAKRCGSR